MLLLLKLNAQKKYKYKEIFHFRQKKPTFKFLGAYT